MARDNWRTSRTDEELRKFSPLFHASTDQSLRQRMTQDSKMFKAYFTDTLAAGGGGTLAYLVRTVDFPSAVSISMSASGADIAWLFVEAPGLSDDGAPLSWLSNNRNVLGTTTTLAFQNTVWAGGGTTIAEGRVPLDVGMVPVVQDEIILDYPQDYLFRIANTSGSVAAIFNVVITAYEPSYEQ